MFDRRIKLAVAFVVVALVTPVASSLAGPLGNTGNFSLTRVDALKSGSGGEFTVYNVKDLSGQSSSALSNESYSASPATRDVPNPFPGGTPIPESFQTFCLEQTEDALLSSANYFVVGSAAAAGGGGSVNGRDPISQGTAWLYSQFAQGLLNVVSTGFNLAGNYFSSVAPARSVEADFLQKAIWWLEQESSPSAANLAANPYYQAAIAHFGGAANAMTDASVGYLGVYVINNFKTAAALQTFLTTGDARQVARIDRGQDFLYYHAVPVPDGGSAAMLLGGALIALGLLRRSRLV